MGRREKAWVAAALLVLAAGCKTDGATAPTTTLASKKGIAVYASGDKTLLHFDFDSTSGALTERASVVMPERIQYVVADAKGKHLYVAASNFSDKHYYAAFAVDGSSGALSPHGDQLTLDQRPIHVTLDRKGEYLLAAYNSVNTISVHQVGADGRIGSVVAQPAPAAGFYTHQVKFLNDKLLAACALGQDARTVTTDGGVTTTPEELGRVHLFSFERGTLGAPVTVTPGAGIGPRHLDAHPTKPWVYVAAERGNKLLVYKLERDQLTTPPAFATNTLADAASAALARQRVGAIHVHPNGKWLYLTNRNDRTVNEPAADGGTVAVFPGGENNVAVYAINEATGEPTLLEHEETRGVEPRTFAIDPTGKFLIVANQKTVRVREGEALRTIRQNLSVFRIGEDGKLTFVSTTDVAPGEAWWVGAVALPG